MKGRTRKVEFRSGDAHGIEGVDAEDVEAAASVHQHLGEVLLANNGVDDKRVATLFWLCGKDGPSDQR